MLMKKYLLLFLLINIFFLIPLFTQSNYEMVVEITMGKIFFNTSDIIQVYFQKKEVIDNNENSCDLKSFYLTDGEKNYHSCSISDSVVQVIVDNKADLTKIKSMFYS